MTDVRSSAVAFLSKQSTRSLVKRYRLRCDALARMQEHEMPRIIIEKQEQMVAEIEVVLSGRGIL